MLSFIVLCGCIAYAVAQSTTARILIYSATAGFRHDSIPTAIEALKQGGNPINVQFDATEDHSQFTTAILSQYDALLFLSTTGEVLDDPGKAAFRTYLNMGGNFIGVHAASDCLRNTSSYRSELGTLFDYHPPLQNAIVNVVGPSHPSTRKLPAAWKVQDEMYNFISDPRAIGATVILSADESSYVDNGTRKFDQGTPHPTAWFQERGAGAEAGGTKGRSFYTSLGHLNETWKDDLFMSHIIGGVSWALQGNTTRAFNASALVGNSQQSTTSRVGAASTAAGPRESAHTSRSVVSRPAWLLLGMGVLQNLFLCNDI
ncbi:uncharacterized protein LACBIDRAFT_173797 [Laccaria bicolor S238N-H82]|uniref:Predicted protein n=1 Tax=Laccaria bicolor (strain S238N-H82 / ATCC MYA-4686) TaxID=486041 RepID=B0D9Z9_LACBS|nr:uncharacterized protein LACBIDRAFT_173797 [Laccaria bicolor S238N-H82]EDR08436.1 predicted protein [Laccaria bicolor S238N-H82]|eukprot:XP_001880661.1 predicted protein [Laccaria bicolor S238N-H82]